MTYTSEDALPFELLEDIFTKLAESSHGNEGTYETTTQRRKRLMYDQLSCTLVCKAWVQPALRLLYKSVTLPMFDPLGRDSVLLGLSVHGRLVHELIIEDVPRWYRAPTPPEEHWSPEDKIFSAITLCPRLQTLHLTLRTYLRRDKFELLILHLQTMEGLEELEVVCKELSRERVLHEDRVFFTPANIHRLVFATTTLRKFVCTPVAPGPHIDVDPHDLQHLSISGVQFGNDLRSLCAPFSRLKELHIRLATEDQLVTQADIAQLLLPLHMSLQAFSLACMSHNVAPPPGDSLEVLPIQECLQRLKALRSLDVLFTLTDTRDYPFDSRIFQYIPPSLVSLKVPVRTLSPDRFFDFLSTVQGRRLRLNITVANMSSWTNTEEEARLMETCKSRGWPVTLQGSYRSYPGLIVLTT